MNRILLAGAVALATLVPAAAQDMSAQEFVTQATSSNMFEIQSSEIAIERSQNEAVQSFAQQMIADHQQVGAMMESIAANSGLEVPLEPQGAPAELLARVEGADGATFDQTYIEAQIAGHEATIDLFQAYAENGDNNALTAFAAETLPGLQMHLNSAQSLDAM